MAKPPEVILVDERDQAFGVMEKLQAHQEGKLHRGFSIFIFNTQGQLLLQQRAAGKYHSAGLWSNTCCGHPRPGETTPAAAERRLKEELGFHCPLQKAFTFTYCAELPNNLIEHEFDHVFIGYFNGIPRLNPKEAAAWRWISLKNLKKEIRQNPEQFTHWFKLCFERAFAEYEKTGV